MADGERREVEGVGLGVGLRRQLLISSANRDGRPDGERRVCSGNGQKVT